MTEPDPSSPSEPADESPEPEAPTSGDATHATETGAADARLFPDDMPESEGVSATSFGGETPSPEAVSPEPTPSPLAPVASKDAEPAAKPPVIEALLVFAALLLLGEGASVGLGIEFAFYDDRLGLATSNTMPKESRTILLFVMGGSALLPLLGGGIYLLWQRTALAITRLERLTRLGAPLLLSAFLPWLFDWRVFKDRGLLFITLATVFGLLFERALRTSFIAASELRAGWAGRKPRATERRWLRWLPGVLVGVMTLGLTLHFAYYTILNHYLLLTHSWDLAIFDNMYWNLIRGKWFKASPDLGRTGSHIQYHANFDAYLFTPFYALRQKADTLLAIQAAVVAGGAVPLYLAVKQRLGNPWYAVVLAYAYCIHAPLHGPVFYDFHFLTLSPFFIGWVLYFYEKESRGPLIASYVLAVLLREDQSATLAAAALFYLMTGKRPRWAIIGGLLSAVLFVVIKFGIMPLHRTSADKETFVWIFKGLLPKDEHSFGSVLKTLVTSPVFSLNWLMDTDKITYVAQAVSPVLLLPVRNRHTWMLLVPAAFFTLLATEYKPAYQSYFQYTANWSSYVFFGAAVCIAAWRGTEYARERAAAAVVAIAVTATAFSYQYGSIFQHNTFRGGFHQVQYKWDEKAAARLADLQTLVELIPKEASVAATELEAPHVSNRENCFTMRFGHDDADYLLVRLSEARVNESHRHMETALKTGQYSFVKQVGEFALWQKGGDHKRDREGARLIKVQLK